MKQILLFFLGKSFPTDKILLHQSGQEDLCSGSHFEIIKLS